MIILSWILIIIGSFFILTSAIGCIRFKDFFVRLHSAGIGDSCGSVIFLLGIICREGFSLFSLKIILLILLLLIVNPTSTYLLAKAAYNNLGNKQ